MVCKCCRPIGGNRIIKGTCGPCGKEIEYRQSEAPVCRECLIGKEAYKKEQEGWKKVCNAFKGKLT